LRYRAGSDPYETDADPKHWFSLDISILISVADPDHFDADPDPAFHFDTDPDPTFHLDTDPEPTV
jgi:hypothetical protein